MELKEYQRESLDVIGQFCDLVRRMAEWNALRPVHDAYHAVCNRDFLEVPQLPGIPYFCLRVPTGGEKTLIAAHAVGAIAKHLGHEDLPLCLWVTPSTTIRDQTLKGLRDRGHPYREALREGLGGQALEVLTIEEALAANRAMVSSAAVVVVTTIQSYRIDEESNRKVYQDNGYLMDHFSGLPAWLRAQLSEPENGRVALSLANVMKMRGPVVIMDEAHNARTRISFDSLARFGPLAVLELTATPQQDHDPAKEKYASNVLQAVSALQLKREGMIKLPVELESRDNWLDVLALTVQRRNDLEQRAQAWRATSGRYVRPIALIQAQPKNKKKETHTIERVRAALVGELGQWNVPPEHVCDHDEMENWDLSSPDCPIRYIVTIEKLREGWDCPFAYVLGSVGNVATETAVEQLLGRVLRMPHATPTGIAELDRAYAVVQSPDIRKTAENLCDSLVSRCGFDKDTVGDALRVHRMADPQSRLPLAAIPVSAPPDTERLPAAVRAKVTYDAQSATIQVREPLTREETAQLRDTLPEADHAAVEEYWQLERGVGTTAKTLDQYAKPLRVPQLIVRDGDRSWLFEPLELDEYAWSLDRCDAAVSEGEFSTDLNIGSRVVLGVNDAGGVRIGGVQEVMARQLSFLADGDDWSKTELVKWLHGEIHHGGKMIGVLPSESQAWLLRMIDYLLTERNADLRVLVRKRHDLARVAITRLSDHGRQQVRAAAQMLIDNRTPRRLETSMDAAAVMEEQDYSPYRKYRGSFDFPKHAFEMVGEMGDEESQCAKRIDDHPNVRRWVRNLSYESAGGFSLPLSPGRFFPDFIAELVDGRLAIIEYKGKHLATLADELHKKEVGELWAGRSNGDCVFVWVVDKDWETLKTGLAACA
ncbi:MAG: DEAD/DEAH box helicase family protein [Pirellulaceae bacterium]|nr:DEAD/DEAH box helicase family protein [Pirellulaceae bacterium]